MSYYSDSEKKNIRVELLDGEARKVAESIVIRRPDGRLDDKQSIKSAQLRRFFGEYRSLQQKVDQRQDDREAAFRAVLPLVRMTKAKAEYAKGRQTVPPAFVAWLCRHADQVSDLKDFEAFMLHFEAVVGYCYGIGLKD